MKTLFYLGHVASMPMEKTSPKNLVEKKGEEKNQIINTSQKCNEIALKLVYSRSQSITAEMSSQDSKYAMG